MISWETFILLIVASVLFFIVPSFFFGHRLARPKRSAISQTPETVNLNYCDISFSTEDNSAIKAWRIPSRSKTITVVVPGFGINKSNLMDIIKPMYDAGLDLLVIDLRGQGEGADGPCTYGINESLDVLSAIKWIRSNNDTKDKPISVFGFSVGASAALLASTKTEDISALIIDSAIYDFKLTTKMALKKMFGLIGTLFVPITIQFYSKFANVNANRLNFVDSAHWLKAKKILMIHGEKDRVSDISLANAAFEKIKIKKEIWITDSEHTHAFFDHQAKYILRVTDFIKQTASTPTI